MAFPSWIEIWSRYSGFHNDYVEPDMSQSLNLLLFHWAVSLARCQFFLPYFQCLTFEWHFLRPYFICDEMQEFKWRSGEDWSYSNWAEGEPGESTMMTFRMFSSGHLWYYFSDVDHHDDDDDSGYCAYMHRHGDVSCWTIFLSQNITRVENYPDITILNSPFGHDH